MVDGKAVYREANHSHGKIGSRPPGFREIPVRRRPDRAAAASEAEKRGRNAMPHWSRAACRIRMRAVRRLYEAVCGRLSGPGRMPIGSTGRHRGVQDRKPARRSGRNDPISRSGPMTVRRQNAPCGTFACVAVPHHYSASENYAASENVVMRAKFACGSR